MGWAYPIPDLQAQLPASLSFFPVYLSMKIRLSLSSPHGHASDWCREKGRGGGLGGHIYDGLWGFMTWFGYL